MSGDTFLSASCALGVDLEGLNRHRVTPLAAQVRADHVDMVEELIRAGAKVYALLRAC